MYNPTQNGLTNQKCVGSFYNISHNSGLLIGKSVNNY